jgi:hypothetical protein
MRNAGGRFRAGLESPRLRAAIHAALPGVRRCAHAAGFKGGDYLLLELRGAVGAAGLVGFDDDAGGLIDDG